MIPPAKDGKVESNILNLEVFKGPTIRRDLGITVRMSSQISPGLVHNRDYPLESIFGRRWGYRQYFIECPSCYLDLATSFSMLGMFHLDDVPQWLQKFGDFPIFVSTKKGASRPGDAAFDTCKIKRTGLSTILDHTDIVFGPLSRLGLATQQDL